VAAGSWKATLPRDALCPRRQRRMARPAGVAGRNRCGRRVDRPFRPPSAVGVAPASRDAGRGARSASASTTTGSGLSGCVADARM
jgi:hypothetical protein